MSLQLWRARDKQWDLGKRTLVMAILNVTPDSFSDGGRLSSAAQAADRAEELVAQGADILDIGGETTRPGRVENVSAQEECARVIPVVAEVRRRMPHVAISIDTYKGEVARRALEEGADIINDIYALRRSPEIADLVASHQAGLILMHMQGEPETMQRSPSYRNLLVEVKDFLRERVEFAQAHGVAEQCLAVDPGIGFGKNLEHNLRIVAELEYLRLLQLPICIGVSRKGFLGKLTGDLPVDQREEATLAASCAAVLNGAGIVRVHNALGMRRALDVLDAIRALR